MNIGWANLRQPPASYVPATPEEALDPMAVFSGLLCCLTNLDSSPDGSSACASALAVLVKVSDDTAACEYLLNRLAERMDRHAKYAVVRVAYAELVESLISPSSRLHPTASLIFAISERMRVDSAQLLIWLSKRGGFFNYHPHAVCRLSFPLESVLLNAAHTVKEARLICESCLPPQAISFLVKEICSRLRNRSNEELVVKYLALLVPCAAVLARCGDSSIKKKLSLRLAAVFNHLLTFSDGLVLTASCATLAKLVAETDSDGLKNL
jgi:hypothetical protein